MASASTVRVRYAETDQMGVAYHANYLIWCEVGRTDYIRAVGVSYAELERQGIRLAVADAQLRFHSSARYDDVVTIDTRLVGVRSRMVTFTYELSRALENGSAERLASAMTSLVALDAAGRPTTLPAAFRALLERAAAGDAP
jgi:acyl-CoA thioester hydrolase